MADEKKKIDRRTFLKNTGIGGVSFVLSSGLAGNAIAAQAVDEGVSKKMTMRILGKTGASVSILGMGGNVDPSAYLNILRIGFSRGINYWDSSHMYNNGRGEETIGEFYGKYPEERKRIFQVTKASMATDPKGLTEKLNTSLERMKTDYIDLYLMHMLQDAAMLTPEIKAWAEQKKKEGKIKFFGFSCHANMAKLLMHASTLGWIDAILSTYNYQLLKNDEMQKAVDACTKANIGLIAMKAQAKMFSGPPPNMPQGREGGQPNSMGPPGGPEGMRSGSFPEMGAQTAGKEPKDLSAMSHFMKKGYTLEQAKLKVVWEDKRFAVCLSEMTNMTMLKDNIAAAKDSVKLTKNDREILDRLAQYDRSYYCHGCSQCESAMGIECRIPDVLRYMMYFNSYGKRDDARGMFKELPENIKLSLATRDYSLAEHACPNKIKIGEAVQEAVRLMG